MSKRALAILVMLTICAHAAPRAARATGVPVGGFLPMVGIGLTDEFDDDLNTFAVPSNSPGGNFLGHNGNPYFDVALLDTGAAVSLLTAQAFEDFNMDGPYPGEPDGFEGTQTIPIGGATGTFLAPIHDPLGLYAAGLQNRTGAAPLTLSQSAMRGQTNTSLISLPPESDLPNVLGLSYASQYATLIRSDQPQLFSLGGRTVRSPSIDFLPLGTGGDQGVVRRAPISLNPGTSFQQPPFWFYNLGEFDLDNPHENPSQPTLIQGAMFLHVDVENEGEELDNFQFFFDTGADVTVVSELNAARLGFDTILDQPDFTVAVVGSGGTTLEVPGFFVEKFTIQAIGGNVTLTNVPVVVLDVTNPADPGNVVDGIVGTNLLAGRNVVIDPNPSLGGGGVGPSLYISDPVTTQKNWTTAAASSSFATASNWSGGTAPTTLSVANVRHVSGGDQQAIITSDATVWELNVSSDVAASMTVRIENGARLTSFAGMNVESGGVLDVASGVVDAQFVEVFGGTLRGGGLITTGGGPVPGQVENRGGTVAPGDGVGKLTIEGRFASSVDGTLEIELGGLTPSTEHDQLVVDGGATIDGILAVSLANLGGGAFLPSVGNTFNIVTATEGISGAFHALAAPGGFNWNLTYGANVITLSVGVSGDYNDDGIVDARDYTVWRDSMGSTGGLLAADGDGDGMVDADDYAIWKSYFGQSLGGSGGATTPVPEPASAILVLFATFATLRRRRTLAV